MPCSLWRTQSALAALLLYCAPARCWVRGQMPISPSSLAQPFSRVPCFAGSTGSSSGSPRPATRGCRLLDPVDPALAGGLGPGERLWVLATRAEKAALTRPSSAGTLTLWHAFIWNGFTAGRWTQSAAVESGSTRLGPLVESLRHPGRGPSVPYLPKCQRADAVPKGLARLHALGTAPARFWRLRPCSHGRPGAKGVARRPACRASAAIGAAFGSGSRLGPRALPPLQGLPCALALGRHDPLCVHASSGPRTAAGPSGRREPGGSRAGPSGRCISAQLWVSAAHPPPRPAACRAGRAFSTARPGRQRGKPRDSLTPRSRGLSAQRLP